MFTRRLLQNNNGVVSKVTKIQVIHKERVDCFERIVSVLSEVFISLNGYQTVRMTRKDDTTYDDHVLRN